jgi:hypothetical protein
MIQFKRFLPLVFLCLFAACGGNDVDCSDPNGLINELNAEINKVNSAAQAFSKDAGNSDLCNEYKNALNGLIDYSRSLFDCTDLNTAVIQTNIDQASLNLEDLPCN